MLLCVDCILQDGHRNHAVDSIKNVHFKLFLVLLEIAIKALANDQEIRNFKRYNRRKILTK